MLRTSVLVAVAAGTLCGCGVFHVDVEKMSDAKLRDLVDRPALKCVAAELTAASCGRSLAGAIEGGSCSPMEKCEEEAESIERLREAARAELAARSWEKSWPWPRGRQR